jgi:hypothetical protein
MHPIAFLLLGTVAVTIAQLLGEIIVNARFLDLISPYFGRDSGDCEFYQSTAIATCVLSCLTLLAFISAPLLFKYSFNDASKLMALGALTLDFTVVICSIILYARVPGWEDDRARAGGWGFGGITLAKLQSSSQSA